MKITNLRVHTVAVGFRNCIFTEIETDAGITGISETVMKRRSLTIAQYITELGRYLIGKDPARIEDHYEKLYRDSFWVGGPMHSTAISAVEIALWDIAGKEMGAPVYRLLGGPTRDAVPVYCHCQSGASPEVAAANARTCRSWGYKTIKTTLPVFYGAQTTVTAGDGTALPAVGYSGTRGAIPPRHKETEYLSPHIWQQMRAYFVAIRDAVGNDLDVAVDCHGRLSPANAVRMAETLADLELLFIEEPVPPENVDALAWVSQRSPVPIAAGERIVTIYGARDLLQKQAVAIFQPDIVNCGGLSQAKKMAALAEAYYIGIAPHNPNGPVATFTGAHLAASIPNFFILETGGSPEDLALFAKVVDPAPVIENGMLRLPSGPGLGVSLKHDAFRQMPYQPFEATR